MGTRGASGEAAAGDVDRPECRNCGSALIGDHCHACGQKAHVHRTLGAFWHDLVHSVLHFEGKMWRTLPMLALRPGELTRRYIDGERARFVSPMAMFLFSVFLMFAAFSVVGPYAYRDRAAASSADADSAPPRAEKIADLREQHADERAENLEEIEALEIARQRIVATSRVPAAVDRDIVQIRQEMTADAAVLEQQVQLQRHEDERHVRHRLPVEGVAIHPRTGVSLGWLDERYAKAKQNPKLLLYKVQSNAYKFSWVLIPISVPLVWLLFLSKRHRRRFKAYDHTVFVTYSIAFMSVFAIAYTVLKLGGLIGTVALLPLILPPIHVFLHLRGACELSWASALWRTIVLAALSLVALALFGALLLILGLLG